MGISWPLTRPHLTSLTILADRNKQTIRLNRENTVSFFSGQGYQKTLPLLQVPSLYANKSAF